MPVIALIKQQGERPDPYAAAFEAAGWEAVVAEPLRVTFVARGHLAAALAAPERWAGLVLTSPRAVEALTAVPRPPGWAERPVWTVGQGTARLARTLGLAPTGEEAGEAAALAEQIVDKRGHDTRPLLFPCGDRRREALPARLRAAGVPFEALVVYRTRPRPGPLLPPNVSPDWAAFFSPSGVRAARADAAFPWRSVRAAAIGRTTAAALRRAGIAPAAVAARPTPDALRDAVCSAATRP